MTKLIHFTNKLTKAVVVIAEIALVISILLVVVNVVMRRVFTMPINGTTEMVCYLCLLVASISLANTEWLDGNVKVTLIAEKTSRKIGDIVEIIGMFVTIPFMSYVTYLLFKLTYSKFMKNDVSVELRFPLYIACGLLAIGFAILIAILVIKLIVRIYDVSHGTHYDFTQNTGDEAAEAIDMVTAAENDNSDLSSGK